MTSLARAGALLVAGMFMLLCLQSSVRAEGQLYANLGPPVAKIVGALHKETFQSVKPVGTSSVVFKVDLTGDIDAAFRPESKLNPRGHFAEVAAFRLARALNLHNVAPAVLRTFTWTDLVKLIKATRPEALPVVQRDVVIRDGHVTGAVIYWIPDMHELGLDKPDGVTRFTRWLSQQEKLVGDKERTLAAQLSTMLCFDYLIGNFDRFSGANMQGDKLGTTLFLRDHNMAFFEPLRTTHHQRVLGRLKRAQRFSRSFVSSLRELDAARLSGALADPSDKPGFQLLTPAQQTGLLDRRATLLSYIAALIDTYGESNVLTFP